MFETSYGPIERALATTHGISDAVRQAGFRSMLSNLQKLGALGPQARVGRGATLKYGPTELHRLILTLEFCELGIPPATAVALVDTYWEAKLKKIIADAERVVEREEPRGNDVIIHLGGVGLRTGPLKGERFPGVPNINSCRLSELPKYVTQWMAMRPDDPVPPRALVVNLSARLRAFHAEFAKTFLEDALADRGREAANAERKPPAPKVKRRKR
jgi:hypothetical protein